LASGPIQLRFPPCFKSLFPPLVEEYTEDLVSFFTVEGARQFGVSGLVTAKFFKLLKKSLRGSVLNTLAQCYLISCSHSMLQNELSR